MLIVGNKPDKRLPAHFLSQTKISPLKFHIESIGWLKPKVEGFYLLRYLLRGILI